ncbi:MAG: DUF421 domain-containing protein [Oscillospiraceae bacterium]|nr:DUF421 domain-containing protein [Oscillospiraceae bacterium]
MLIVFIRGIIVYFLVIFATRVMGKRQLGELSPSELVITILISNIATLAMEDPEASLITGVVPILTLVCLDILASFAALKSRKLRHVISGRPKVIISNGKLDQAVMKELRFMVDDVCSALRNSGVFDIDEVQYAVVETTGTISVLLKAQNRPVTPETLTTPETTSDPPQILISDGDIIASGMNGAGLDEKALRKELKRKHLEPSEVLLCMMRPDNTLYIIPKEK